MPEVRADLVLDSAAAFSSVDDVGSAIDAITTDIPITIDTAEAVANIDALQGEVAAALGSLDGSAQVTIEVDDSQVADAAAAVEGLNETLSGTAETSQQAAGGMGETAGAAGALGVAMNVAKGEAGAAHAGLLGLAGASGGVVAGIGAAVGAFGAFFAIGEKSVAATERMTLVFGEFADEAESIDIGGLTGDLADLAVQSGNSGAQLRQASAALGTAVQSLGITKEASADVVNQFQAIALRATAMNPQLGEAGDVMKTLNRALASGGRFAQNLGLGFLNAGKIADRASIMFHKPTSELTTMEKAIAGAAIATETLGNKLGKDFSTGIKQSAVQFKALKAELISTIATMGRPLVEPILNLSRALVPLAAQFGTMLGAMAQSFVPILQTVTGLLDALGPTLSSSALAAGLLALKFGAVGAAAGALIPILNEIDPALAGAAVSIGTMAFVGSRLVADLPGVSAGLGATAGAAVGLGSAIGGAAGNMISFAGAGALAGTAIGGPGLGTAIGAATGALVGLGAALLDSGESAEEAAKRYTELAKALQDMSAAQAYKRFMKELDNGNDNMVVALRKLATESPALARKVVEGYRQTGQSAQATAQWIDRYLNPAVERGTRAFEKKSVASTQAAAADRATADAAVAAAGGFDVQAKAAEDAAAAVAKWVEGVVGTLPTAQTVLSTTASNLQSFGAGLDIGHQGADAFLNSLNDAVSAIQNFSSVTALLSVNFPNTARMIAEAGPIAGTAFAKSFNDATPETQAAIEAQLGVLGTLPGKVAALFTGPVGQQVAGGWNTALSTIPDMTAAGMAAAGQALTANTPTTDATAAGASTADAFGTGVAPLPDTAGTAVGAVGPAVTAAGTGLYSPANVAGMQVGASFGDGVAGGIASRAGMVATAARTLVQIAMEAGRNEAAAASPSKKAAQMIGLPIGLGVAAGMLQATRQVENASAHLVSSAWGRTGAGPSAAAGAGTKVVLIKVDSFDQALMHIPVHARSAAAHLEGF